MASFPYPNRELERNLLRENEVCQLWRFPARRLTLTSFFFFNFQQKRRRKREIARKLSKLKRTKRLWNQQIDEDYSSDEEQLMTSYSLNNYLIEQRRAVQALYNLRLTTKVASGG